MGGKPSPRDRFRKRKKMNVLIVEPGKHPRLADIDESLESLQKIVGGYIEAIYLFEDEIAIICDEELKLKSEIEWNKILRKHMMLSKVPLLSQDLEMKISRTLCLNLQKRTNSVSAILNFSFQLLTV